MAFIEYVQKFFIPIRDVSAKYTIIQQALAALEKVGMADYRDRQINQLSGGQQQLVAVARAVIAEPKVILADEPTGSLHSSQGRQIMGLLK